MARLGSEVLKRMFTEPPMKSLGGLGDQLDARACQDAYRPSDGLATLVLRDKYPYYACTDMYPHYTEYSAYPFQKDPPPDEKPYRVREMSVGIPPGDPAWHPDLRVPKGRNKALWVQPQMPVGPGGFFVPVGGEFGDTDDVVRRLVWSTPVFDLRPDFRGAMGSSPLGVQPIWTSDEDFPEEPQLYVQVDAPNRFAGLEFYAMEAGDVMDPDGVAVFTKRRPFSPDMTEATSLATRQRGMILFSVPGGSLRYWQATVVVDQVVAGPVPTLYLKAGMY